MPKTLTLDNVQIVSFNFIADPTASTIVGGEIVYRRLLDTGEALDTQTCTLDLRILVDRINWIGANELGWLDPPLAVENLASLMLTSLHDMACSNEELVTLPPSAPETLIATASATSVSLSWDASLLPVTSYSVERADASGIFTAIGTAAAPNYTDSTPQPNVTYRYRVVAVNATGQSLPSPESAASLLTS